MKVRLNLATNALQTHRKFLAGATLTGVIAGLIALALGWHVYSVRKSNAALRARSAEVRQEMLGLMRQRQDMQTFFAQERNARLNDRSMFLNSLIDERSLNWTQMFMDFEKVLPSGVRLVNIEPAHEKGQVLVKLHIGAINDEAKLKFMRALESSPAFRGFKELGEKISDPQAGSSDVDHLQVELVVVYARS